MGAVNCCVGGTDSCIGPWGAANSPRPAFAFVVTRSLYTGGGIMTRGFSARFADFGRVRFFYPAATHPAGLPAQYVRRLRRPGTGVCPARGPGGASSCRQTKFSLGGASGTFQQKRSNGPADQPAGWARGGCSETCRGQISSAATGCRLCRPRQTRSGWRVTPPLSCFPFFGVIWAFGTKNAEVP